MNSKEKFPWFSVIATCVLLIVVTMVGCTSCTLVQPGHVGIRVERAGAGRGVQDLPIVSGYVWYNPITTTIIEFPTTVQTRIWTQSPHEGQSIDESITFQSSEGMPINADIALSYHIDPQHAGRFYTRFRTTDLSQLTDGYVRNLVRDAMVERAATHTIHDLFGAAKTALITEALSMVSTRLGHDGFVIDQLSYQGQLRFPQNIIDSINRTVQAQQDAQQAQNQVAIREAEGRQRVAQAESAAAAARAEADGQASVARTRAQAEADALLIRTRADAQNRQLMSEAEAGANTRVAASLTQQLIDLRRIQAWDGHLPPYQFGGGAVPILNMPAISRSQGP